MTIRGEKLMTWYQQGKLDPDSTIEKKTMQSHVMYTSFKGQKTAQLWFLIEFIPECYNFVKDPEKYMYSL